MKILILGDGFFGKTFIEALQFYDIFVLSKNRGCDLTNPESAKQFIFPLRPEIIINCVAVVGSVHFVQKKCADVLHDNILMSANIYNSVKDLKCRIINPLANCAYPGNEHILCENNWLCGDIHPSVHAFGSYKRALYALSRAYKEQYGIESINFIVPNTFGPGDSSDPQKTHALNGMIIRMIQAKRNNDKTFEIWGSGSPIREWAYVDDVINIMKESLKWKHDLIEPVNIAQSKGYSIKESAEMIKEILNYDGKLVFNTDYQDGAPIKIMDDKKFRTLFPNFQFTDHKIALQNTINYYLNNL